MSSKVADLEGIVKAKTEALEVQHKVTQGLREDFQKTVVEKNKEIEKWKGISSNAEAGMAEGDIEIADLKRKIRDLDSTQKDEKIIVQANLIQVLESNLTLAHHSLAAKDNTIAALEKKYNDLFKYTEALEVDYRVLQSLDASKDDLANRLKKELIAARRGSKVRNVIIAAVGGYLVYSLVKK
jgi:hypothetical protein